MAAQVPLAEQNVFPEQGPLPQANAADFGGQIGQATEGLGQNISQTGDIEFQRVMKWQNLKNEATAQDLDVQFQGDLGKLETGYYALKGKAAADAYPKFQSDIAALRQQYLGTANGVNPMVANMLGGSVNGSVGRSLRYGGQYAGQQTKSWMIESASSRNEMLINQGARNYADNDYQKQVSDALDAGAKNYAELNGLSEDGEKIYRAKLEQALQQNRTVNAKAFIQSHSIGDQAAALLGVQPGTSTEVGGANYHRFVLATEFGTGQNDPNNPEHQGPVQASQAWWDRFGAGGDRNNVQDSLKALDNETAYNLPRMEAALGRKPTDGELYLAHQQNLPEALALIQHPNDPAVNVLTPYYKDPRDAEAAVAGNVHDKSIDPTKITAGQFASLYNAGEASGSITPANGTGVDKQLSAAVAVLSDEDKQTMTKQVLDNWRIQSNAAYEDQQHQQAAAAKAEKQQYDDITNQAKSMISANWADPTKPPLDIGKFAQTPWAQEHPDAVTDLLKYRNSLTKPDGDPGASARNASSLFGKMFPSDGSPGLTQRDIDNALVSQDPSQHINISEHDWLTKQLEDAKDPTSKRLNGQANDVFKVVERQIDPSITGSMGDQTHSPFSGTRMLQYKQAVQDKIAAFKTAGKDPAVLFDPTPGNKDYVGSAGFIAPYTRSLQDLMTEEATGQEAQPVAAATQPGVVPAPDVTQPVVSVPPDLPAGTTYAGKLKDGRDAFRTPDGTLQAARAAPAQGIEEMQGKLHLDPAVAPRVPEGAPRPFGMGEYIENPDGSTSNEITVTVENPKLNGGKPTILPSLWLSNGKAVKVNEDQAAEYALKSGLKFPSFATEAEAEKFAVDREAKWQTINPKNASQVAALWDQGPAPVPTGQ